MSIADGELTTLAFCWRLVRRDGAALGFTTHDRDLVIDGLGYRAAPGMLPSAVLLGEGVEADAQEMAGAVTSDAIGEADLAAGRWDGAAFRLFAVDWTAPEGEKIALARGDLGEVVTRRRRFETELRGPQAALERPVGEFTSPECRAELGDRRCRVDMAGRSVRAVATAIDGDGRVTVTGGGDLARFAFGALRFVDGANSGLRFGILSADVGTVYLGEPPPFALAGEVAVLLTEGCDKTFDTCRVRFANIVNFRGEPHLPGNDLLTRYPGS